MALSLLSIFASSKKDLRELSLSHRSSLLPLQVSSLSSLVPLCKVYAVSGRSWSIFVLPLVLFFCPFVFSLLAWASFVSVILWKMILDLSCTCKCIQFGSMFSLWLLQYYHCSLWTFLWRSVNLVDYMFLKYCKLACAPYLVLTSGSFVPPLLAPMP